MLMMSNAIFFINSFTLEQINIQYQDDVAIGRPEKKEQLLQFFIDQFNEEDKEKIITLTEKCTGIKALSLTCDEESPPSIKRKKRIISSVIFEYQPYGAYIHYFETTDMKQSTFKKLFVIKESKNIGLEEYIREYNPCNNLDRDKLKDGVLLHLNEAGDDNIVMRGKGTGRFMLHLLQALTFCRNGKFELHLKSAEESLEFYKPCNFLKQKLRVIPTTKN